MSIANSYCVLRLWSCRHIQRLQLQVSINSNDLHTLWWKSVAVVAEGIPVHQDLLEGKAEGIKSQLGSSNFFAGKSCLFLPQTHHSPKRSQVAIEGVKKVKISTYKKREAFYLVDTCVFPLGQSIFSHRSSSFSDCLPYDSDEMLCGAIHSWFIPNKW